MRKDLQFVKTEYEGGHLEPGVYAAILNHYDDMLQGMGSTKAEKKKKRKEKVKNFFKKFGHGAAFISLAPVRGAFASLIAMNLNGLASNMRLVKEGKNQEGWKKLQTFWYKVGGIPKALDKAIAIGTKHKALWFGKKAHAKFLAHAKEAGYNTNEKWLRGIDGLNSINGPELVPALIAAGSSLLAGALPIVIKALHQNGHTAQAQIAAGGGEDLIDAGPMKQDTLDNLTNMPGEQQVPDEDVEVDDTFTGINALCESVASCYPETVGAINFDFNEILGPLTNLADQGLKAAASAVQKKVSKNPALQKVFSSPDVDEHYTSANLKGAGRVTDAGQYKKRGGLNSTLVYVLGGSAIIGGALLLSGRKRK